MPYAPKSEQQGKRERVLVSAVCRRLIGELILCTNHDTEYEEQFNL
jgi:hypothetical protein